MRRHGSWLALLLLAHSPLAAQDAPPPPVPQGVEVQARGPVHEAFASPTAEPTPTRPVPKKPPAAIEEVPPDEKPDGDVVWIGGYWAWDDDRADFLWVSGVWRTQPPGRRWVAGYWREEGTQWQWVPGFWAAAKKGAPEQDQEVTYLPAPPAAPETAPPAKPPTADSFYVPGSWTWAGDRYVFRAGYWARVQPGYVWVPDHFRWTPSGYVFVPGYWDLALKRRGILYAPVVIDPAVVTVGFVYTPTYAVRDTVVVESLFVRPVSCHYYFGDYYAASYRTLGFESCVVYSRRRYEPIVVYEVYERRDPAWIGLQINLYNDRCVGRVPRPPRTLVQQNTTVINNTTVVNNNTTVVNNVTNNTLIAPTKQVAMTKNTNLVKLDDSTRQKARAQAAVVQQAGQQRVNTEVAPPPGAPREPRTASLAVPKAEPVRPGMAVPPPVTAKAPPARGTSATPPLAVKPAAPGMPGAPNATTLARPTAAANASPAGPNAKPGAQAAQPATRWLPAVPAAKQPGQPRPGAAQPGAQPRPAPTRKPPPKKEEKERRPDR
ncbi:MAG: hypothetical protein U0797_18845 [Gemmataceae bacterium]